jgi:hypothetical protein
MAPLPPLASTDDIVARLGAPLSASQAVRAESLLRDASVQVRRYCKKDFLYHTGDVVNVHMHDSEIKLPGKPIDAVTAVVAKGSSGEGLPDINLPWFVFDQIDSVRIDPGSHSILNLPEAWWEYTDLYRTFQVTYNHGFHDVPDEVVMVVANAALAVLQAPTMASGLIGETIGPYSYRLERGGGGVLVAITQSDKEILRDFRESQATSFVELR